MGGDETATAMIEMTRSIQAVADDAEALATSVEEIATAMEETGRSINGVRGNADSLASSAAFLKRDDIRDALIHPGGLTIDELPAGTRIGTSSVRRVAQLAATHPEWECVPFRGNVNRRPEKPE